MTEHARGAAAGALPQPGRPGTVGERSPTTVELGLRRIYILPTRHGVLFAVLLLVMLLGSINYNLSLGYAFTFLLGSVALVSILHTYRNLAGLRITPGKAQPVFAGQEAVFPIHLYSGTKPRRCMIGVQRKDGSPVFSDVPPETPVAVSLNVVARHRGTLHLGRFKVFSEYPLGLFHAWSWIDPESSCVVYPRPGKAAPATRAGTAPSGRPDRSEEGDDFAGFRKYRAGDPLSHVAWKATARGQGLLTKQFSGPAQETLWLDWDALPGLNPEERLARLCRAVLNADAAGHRYGLRLPGKSVAPASGESHKRACLTALALFRGAGAVRRDDGSLLRQVAQRFVALFARVRTSHP